VGGRPGGDAAALADHDDVLREAIEAQGAGCSSTRGMGVRGVQLTQGGSGCCGRRPASTGITCADGDFDWGSRAAGFGLLRAVLNRAARVMAAGHGGQILLDGQTAGLLRRVDLVDLGRGGCAT